MEPFHLEEICLVPLSTGKSVEMNCCRQGFTTTNMTLLEYET